MQCTEYRAKLLRCEKNFADEEKAGADLKVKFVSKAEQVSATLDTVEQLAGDLRNEVQRRQRVETQLTAKKRQLEDLMEADANVLMLVETQEKLQKAEADLEGALEGVAFK